MNPLVPEFAESAGGAVSLAGWWLLAGLALFLWGWAHRAVPRFLAGRMGAWAGALILAGLGVLALAAFWTAVGRTVWLATPWPLLVHAVIGSLAVEGVWWLYSLEKRLVPRRAGRWLTGLRLVAVGAVLTILAQPVFSRQVTRTVDRNVVVLLDESESMQQADAAMPVGERLRLAAWLGLGGQQGRPALAAQMAAVPALVLRLEAEMEKVRPPDSGSGDEARGVLELRRAVLSGLLEELTAWSTAAGNSLDDNSEDSRKLSTPLRQLLRQTRHAVVDELGRALREAAEALANGESRPLRTSLREASALLSGALAEVDPLVEAVDTQFFNRLPEALRSKIHEAAGRSRRDLALEALRRGSAGQPGLLEMLEQKYTVKFMQFGRGDAVSAGLPAPPGAESPLRTLTDLTAALTNLQQAQAPEHLAGVVLLSDARHNGIVPPDEIARRLGLQGSPVCPVLVGSTAGARDVSITDVSHPDSIFLGDRLRVKASLKAAGLRGRAVRVSLRRGDAVVQEQTLEVPEDFWRTTVTFDDVPEAKGIFRWTVQVEAVEGEQFAQNNTWTFPAAVSDDRTNVLLIDDRPRWEFRYLRNLFDSRDKSVQLQYVLLHPDDLEGAPPSPVVPAAAGRPFGESAATALPASPAEWRKFDVIIVGDVPPDRLRPETWQILRECAADRGAVVVFVAGPHFMPHAFGGEAARDLIPVRYSQEGSGPVAAPEPAYRLALTAAGRRSPVFAGAAGTVENTRIWEQMPLLHWRHPHGGAKEGTEVLAWAQPAAEDGTTADGAAAHDAGDPAGELQRRRQLESSNALVVAAQTGPGKVVMLTFDQTWRFRYGVGDTWHHRFWGQLLRWGAGANLPSGTAAVRLGTDRLNYAPGAPVTVQARLRDGASRPVTGARVKAVISSDGREVASRVLEFSPDSQGFYEGQLPGLNPPGNYTVTLSGPEVERLAAAESSGAVSHPITVGASGNAVELGDLTADPELARKVAGLSGGMVAGFADAAAVIAKFGPGTTTVQEREETRLWDHWLLLALAAAALTAEWILRRRLSLA